MNAFILVVVSEIRALSGMSGNEISHLVLIERDAANVRVGVGIIIVKLAVLTSRRMLVPTVIRRFPVSAGTVNRFFVRDCHLPRSTTGDTLEVGVDKPVNMPVHNGIHVAFLISGSRIFYKRIRHEDV